MRHSLIGQFVLTACLTGLFGAANASAAIVTSLVPSSTQPTAEAKTDDPSLNNRTTYNLLISVAQGEDWTNSEWKLNLTSGTIYNSGPPVASDTPNQAFWGITGFRQSQFDTFVSAPNFTVPSVAGRHPADGVGAAVFSATAISAAWFDNVQTPGAAGGSQFVIGRVTLSNDAVGTFLGSSFSSLAPGAPVTFTGAIAPIPEPSTIALAAIAIVAIGFARRRQMVK